MNAAPHNPTFGEYNQWFLNQCDDSRRNKFVQNIADHYGISYLEALSEVIYPEAEHILDYLTGDIRTEAARMVNLLGA